MRRREFIALLGGAATWSLAARAQDAGRTYRIGFLLPSPRNSPAVVAMFDQLRLNGFVEGQNLIVIPGGFGVPNDQIAGVVASLVAASPDVIVAGPELPLRALSLATRTIPLVGMSEDMVADGLVASFARPGGNIRGISLLSPELDGKRQEIVIEAVPGVRKIAVLVDSNVAKPVHLQQLQQAAESRGVEALIRGVAKPEDGALIGYGPRFTGVYRMRANMAATVLRGTMPADIPIEQPTRFELIINLKTAKTIGHPVPSSLLLHADRVIE